MLNHQGLQGEMVDWSCRIAMAGEQSRVAGKCQPFQVMMAEVFWVVSDVSESEVIWMVFVVSEAGMI